MRMGRIHSFESMGLVDGPGIRSVVFLQGCALRCRYCHNPDTWDRAGGEEIAPEALVRRLSRFKAYYDRSGGGVTFSGGEPLLQPEFLTEALRLCREAGISTCIDTAGVGHGDYTEILRQTDLVLYDVKHYAPDAYRALVGCDIAATERFVEAVRISGTPMWVRHVVVPGLTDSWEHLAGLRDYVRTLPRVQRVELLPYHRLGAGKYETMKLPYPLADTPVMDKDVCKQLELEFFSEFGGDRV